MGATDASKHLSKYAFHGIVSVELKFVPDQYHQYFIQLLSVQDYNSISAESGL